MCTVKHNNIFFALLITSIGHYSHQANTGLMMAVNNLFYYY